MLIGEWGFTVIDVTDGIKAGGSGRILLKHLVRISLSIPVAIIFTALLRLYLGKETLIPWDAEYFGALAAVVLVQVVGFFRELIRNGEVKK